MTKITKLSLISTLIVSVLFLSACTSSTLAGLPLSIHLGSGEQTLQVAPTPSAVESPTQSTPNSVTNSPGAVQAFQGTLEAIYNQVNPSVVNIQVEATTQGLSNFGSQGSPLQQGLGSGFVWDTQGHIITNNHVVDGADEITVTFADGSSYNAELVGADPNSDLAVIQIDAPAGELQPLTLADSSQVRVGQLAIAIGNPFGLSGTMTVGIVSALSRSLPVGLDSLTSTRARYSIPDIIQTDASINPGNSGGVLVDDQGQLIGVTTAIQSTTGANSGIGFVIPSNIVEKVAASLIETGKAEHPYMGISGTTLTPDLVSANDLPTGQAGALVLEVRAGSPAEKAGLQGAQTTSLNGQSAPRGGDVIIAIDGTTVNRFEDMVSYLFNNAEPGQTITLTILRDGRQREVQLTLGVLPNNF